MERKITYDLTKLHQMVDGMQSNLIVKVGIFGNKTGRKDKGKTNAEIGAQHEYGSFSKGIPMRSFLRMPVSQMSDGIINETSKGIAQFIVKGNWRAILINLGIACERVIHKAFSSRGFGSWKPNAPSTIRRKKSDSPLIDTRQLERSIASKVDKRAAT